MIQNRIALPSANHKVEIFWPKAKYYLGIEPNMDDMTDKRHVKYDDGDEEILDFTEENGGLFQTLQKKSACSIDLVFHQLSEKQGSLSGYPINVHVVITVNDRYDPRFLESSREEIQGILDKGTYAVVSEMYIPPEQLFYAPEQIDTSKRIWEAKKSSKHDYPSRGEVATGSLHQTS